MPHAPAPIFVVLKTGGEFTFSHAVRLYIHLRRCRAIGPEPSSRKLVLLSDKAFGAQLPGLINLHNPDIGPRWWGKIDALQYCDERGMWLVDLDTTIFRFPDDPEQSTFNADFYTPGRYGSGFCYMTKRDADAVWSAYNRIGPPLVQERFSGSTPETLGDQAFIASVLGDRPIFPEDQVCSFKKHVRKRGGIVPSTADVVCFHGKPRPWSISELSPPPGARGGRSSGRG